MMSNRFIQSALMLAVVVVGVNRQAAHAADPAAKPAAIQDRVDFSRDIRPILSENCFQCHGPDDKSRKAKLRLDTRDGAFADLDGYSALVAGKPHESELFLRITSDDKKELMPPPKSGKELSATQVTLLKKWIEQGADWSQHWSFMPVKRHDLPKVKQANWPRHAIDHFILAKLESVGLKPAPEAERQTWIRRVSLDLTGLPPTIAELDAFLADKSPKAYEKVVDRLLASKRYGEHQARPWLDGARYADTNGYQYDRERTQWPWRDWVIHAFNENMPFDQFTIEQLAGDMLPNATEQQRLATAFNRNHPITIEGGVIDEEYRTEYVMDRVVTTGTVWMGMTFLCARCHDHKFDPISQKEFYQFFTFFNQVPERGNNGFDPRMPVTIGNQKEIQSQVAAVEAKLKAASPQIAKAQAAWEKTIAAEAKGPLWQVITPTKVTASSGAKLQQLPDQSTLAIGGKPAAEIYDITIKTTADNLTAIRLECLTHPSLPLNGPGKAFNSNFVLSGFEAIASPINGNGKPQKITFKSAVADYSQKNYEIARAIDGRTNTGWAVDGPTKKENRVAVFTADKPFGFPGGTQVQVRLLHHFGSSHNIGRFRLALTDRPGAGFFDDITSIASLPASKRSAAQQQQLAEHFLSTAAPADIRVLHKELASLRTQASRQSKRVSVMVMADMAKPRATHVLERGEYDQKREPVTADTPAVLPPLPNAGKRNRLDLARWLVSKDHPLTARVTVNRFWQHLFGHGIVKTSEDFGSQSEFPSHPELLDWLASEFIKSGWDVKQLHKDIVLSATYRQSSFVSSQLAERDPENRLLARGPRKRLDGESIRDQALFISGLLIEEIGGPSVYPYHPKGLWLEINNRPGYSRAYPHQTNPQQLYRRSMYTFWKRTVPPPSMQAFDAPEREFCVVKRSTTNTPLQPFVLMHGPQFVEASRFLAQRMMIEGGKSPEEKVAFAFRLLTSRKPSAAESGLLVRAFKKRLVIYRGDHDAAKQMLSVGVSPRDTSLNEFEHAAWTAVARLMFNLSEAITKP